ncbi:hypothetical protein [Stutzerimonas degradans]|uniref:hypothetical protein n=1 Tax=Stutzerimonas degradans TaxID=2968968 RepID=UPI00141E234F|nr:hypothetical protein [Stutzerimonas degradans]NHW02449.1 hypothetical protein [Stutzerimonas degradans]
MTDPLARATAEAPPIIGSGCTQRYDPAALGTELGTDFPGAAELWERLRAADGQAPADVSRGTGRPAGRDHDALD